jgi:hypothetical protein
VRFLHKAVRPHVATIASTDKGATIETMPGVTTETMGHGLTRIETTGYGLIQGHTTTMTNKKNARVDRFLSGKANNGHNLVQTSVG